MSNQVEVTTDVMGLELPHIKRTPYGIEFDGAPSLKEWFAAVQAVQSAHSMCQFYLGDLVVFAESDPNGWGESKYDELVNATGYDNGTLRVFASVARRFSPSFREAVLSYDNNRLSFHHFRMVASLPDEHARHFLEMVQEGGWSVARLAEEVAKFKESRRPVREIEDEDEEYEQELPDGWAPMENAPEYLRYYIPAAERVNSSEPSIPVELERWEIEKLFDDYDGDETMISLCDRLELALKGM